MQRTTSGSHVSAQLTKMNSIHKKTFFFSSPQFFPSQIKLGKLSRVKKPRCIEIEFGVKRDIHEILSEKKNKLGLRKVLKLFRQKHEEKAKVYFAKITAATTSTQSATMKNVRIVF